MDGVSKGKGKAKAKAKVAERPALSMLTPPPMRRFDRLSELIDVDTLEIRFGFQYGKPLPHLARCAPELAWVWASGFEHHAIRASTWMLLNGLDAETVSAYLRNELERESPEG